MSLSQKSILDKRLARIANFIGIFTTFGMERKIRCASFLCNYFVVSWSKKGYSSKHCCFTTRRPCCSKRQTPRCINTEFGEEEVKKICQLAQVQVDQTELKQLAADFNSIVELIQKMDKLDLNGTQAAEYIINAHRALREDSPRNFEEKETLFNSAPSFTDGFYQVPKILEDSSQGSDD